MDEKELTEILFAKDTKEIYEKFKNLEFICNTSNELYLYFDTFIVALHNSNSCVRSRGFKLILRNAKWDRENKINKNLKEILDVLDDEKPTVVRQCIPLLSFISAYKKELIPSVRKKIMNLNYLKYKDSMQGLIKKDIDNIIKFFDENN